MDEFLDLVQSTLAMIRPKKRIMTAEVVVAEVVAKPVEHEEVVTKEKPEQKPTLPRNKELLEQAYPGMKFVGALPDDSVAKQIKERWQSSPASKPVWIVTNEQPHPMLFDLERAITERLKACALIVHPTAGNPEFLIVEEGCEALAEKWPKAKLLVIPTAATMAANPALKTQVWKKLQAHVCLDSPRKRL